MKQVVTVSVCIANFNGEAIIESCIESVLKQTTKVNIEVIVHDDFSSDKSVDIIKKKYKNIKLIISNNNVGFCIANNRMAMSATGEYLLFLNNDAELFPDAIEVLVTAATSVNASSILGLPQYLTNTHNLIDCGAFIDLFFNAVPSSTIYKHEVAMVAGACLWIPKLIWDELGGFPDWFESIAEDLFLCCNARLAGYPVVVLAASGFYHRVGSSFGGGKIEKGRILTTFKRRQLSERNKLFTILAIMPVWWLWLFLPVHIVVLLIEGIILSVIKWDIRIWNDIYSSLVPAIYRYRQQLRELRSDVQKHKRTSFKYWLSVMQWQPYKIKMFIKYGVPNIR